MNGFDKITAASTSGLAAQTKRLQVTSENIANVDTNGYQRKLLQFSSVYDRATGQSTVDTSDVFLDRSEAELVYDPGNPLADETGYVAGSNVNIMNEIADAREANRSYNAGLEIFRQARGMYSSLLEILRRS